MELVEVVATSHDGYRSWVTVDLPPAGNWRTGVLQDTPGVVKLVKVTAIGHDGYRGRVLIEQLPAAERRTGVLPDTPGVVKLVKVTAIGHDGYRGRVLIEQLPRGSRRTSVLPDTPGVVDLIEITPSPCDLLSGRVLIEQLPRGSRLTGILEDVPGVVKLVEVVAHRLDGTVATNYDGDCGSVIVQPPPAREVLHVRSFRHGAASEGLHEDGTTIGVIRTISPLRNAQDDGNPRFTIFGIEQGGLVGWAVHPPCDGRTGRCTTLVLNAPVVPGIVAVLACWG